MKARIEVPTHVHDHTDSALIGAAKSAVLALLEHGGTGAHRMQGGVHVYTFDGDPSLVRNCIASYMACIEADGT